MEPWIVRAFRPGDRAQLTDMLGDFFEYPDPDRYFTWIYLENPAGLAWAWVACEQGTGRIVGSDAFFPWRLTLNGRLVPAIQMANAMVLPAYRRRGIFTALIKEGLQRLKNLGIEFVYGFPNQRAVPGHRKAGAVTLGRIVRVMRPINLARLSSRFQKGGGVICGLARLSRYASFSLPHRRRLEREGLQCRAVDRCDERFDDLWMRRPADLGIAAVRDREFLHWKYESRPFREYTVWALESRGRSNVLLGYAVSTVREGVLSIVDMLVAGEDEASHARSLIHGLIDQAQRRGCGAASFHALEGNRYLHAFYRNGFVPYSRRDTAIVYPLVDAGSEYVTDCRNWHLTMGDQE